MFSRKAFFIMCSVLFATILFIICRAVMHQHQAQAEIRRLQVELARAQKYQPLERKVIRDTVEVVKQQAIYLDRTDYKQQLADRQLISDLQMKISQIEAEQTTTITQHDTFQLQLQPDSVLRYRDHWVDFVYTPQNAQLTYKVRDSLTFYVERIPRHRFLWMRWGTRGYEMKAVSHNPHASITYNSFIRVNK